MNRIESILDVELRKMNADVMVLAYCFLLMGFIALYIMPPSMYLWDDWLIKQYHITSILETPPMLWMNEPFNQAFTLYKILVVWVILNFIQSLCYCLDQLQRWWNIRKWGYYAV